MDVVPFTPRPRSRSSRCRRSRGGCSADETRRRRCRVVIVNEEAAAGIFDGDAVGRSIEDPAGQRVEIIGVVASRQPENAADRLARRSTTTRSRRERRWRRPARRGFAFPCGRRCRAMLDANVVSRSYFDAMGLTPMAGSVFPDESRASAVPRRRDQSGSGGALLRRKRGWRRRYRRRRPPDRDRRRRSLGAASHLAAAGRADDLLSDGAGLSAAHDADSRRARNE